MKTKTRSEVSSLGVDNWRRLTLHERFSAARWAALTLHRTRGFRRLGAGVVGIGFGVRERRPKSRGKSSRFGRTPVLVVIVKSKWKAKHRGPESKAIPRRILIRVSLATRRLWLAIPTDVCVPGRPRPHADRNACQADSMKAGAKSVDGSVAALVRNAGETGGPIYLLGCQHVIHRTLVTHNAVPDETTRISSEGVGAKELGMAARPAPFGPQIRSLDAALVRLTPDGLEVVSHGAFWRKIASAYVQDETELAMISTLGWKLYTRFEPVGLKFVRTLFDEPIPYGSNHVTIRIAEVVVSRSTGRSPRDGDSGGAVMAGPVLVGIHIAGKGSLSYCIPSYRLFSTSAFSPKLELASDLIS